MTETQKLRELFEAYEVESRRPSQPEYAAGDRERLAALLVRVQAQSVLALEEQLVDYRRTVRGTDVVQCRACGGRGYTIIGISSAACSGCKGSGLVRV